MTKTRWQQEKEKLQRNDLLQKRHTAKTSPRTISIPYVPAAEGKARKVLEGKLRRMAKRQGLVLVKNRRRDPVSPDFNRYGLSDASDTPMLGYDEYGYDNVLGIGPTLTLETVNAVLSYGWDGLMGHLVEGGDYNDPELGESGLLEGFDEWCEDHTKEILKAAEKKRVR